MFGPLKTVDSVMATFTKALSGLRAVTEEQLMEADRQAGICAEAALREQEAMAEADRAAHLVTKLEELLR